MKLTTATTITQAPIRRDRSYCTRPQKVLREHLETPDRRIKSCEQADLDLARVEVARSEAAVTAVAKEATRLQVDMNAPPRVSGAGKVEG